MSRSVSPYSEPPADESLRRTKVAFLWTVARRPTAGDLYLEGVMATIKLVSERTVESHFGSRS